MIESLATKPSKCPVCAIPLTNYSWRRHMKKRHGWTYALGGDTLYPPSVNHEEV